jgi:hypothetical protein
MTDRCIVQEVAEVGCLPTPHNALSNFQGEVLSRASLGSDVAIITPETATAPLPPTVSASLMGETLAQPWPPIDLPVFLLEMLRRDTASSAIVATSMNAFGDQPWPSAQRGVFAFRHDWSEPLVERLEWQTSVSRLASGNESRQARRRIPRRLLTYKVGNSRPSDALVADWLADHIGKPAMWPLPQYAVHLIQTAERGVLALEVTDADWRQFIPHVAAPRLTYDGMQVSQDDERWVLIIAVDGWQIAPLSDVESGMLWLVDPLARAAQSGSTVMPLVCGSAVEPVDLTQWVPGMVSGSTTANITPAQTPDTDIVDDPWLDDLPIWPDGNWRDDPSAAIAGVITHQDFSPAEPWIRRDDPWPATTFQRRYLASTPEEIENWRARLWRTQGRLEAFWLPDGLAPVLWVTAEAEIEDGFLRVKGNDAPAFWHRPAACVIVQPDGYQQHALTATCHQDQGHVLVLRSSLDEPVPVGSRVIRLARCRLDHDAIDFYWHNQHLVEIHLTARQLPEPRGNDRITYEPA